jgi:hypothetical protein
MITHVRESAQIAAFGYSTNRLQNGLTGTSHFTNAFASMSAAFLPLDNSVWQSRSKTSLFHGVGLLQREGHQISEMFWRLNVMLSRGRGCITRQRPFLPLRGGKDKVYFCLRLLPIETLLGRISFQYVVSCGFVAGQTVCSVHCS